MGVVKDKRGVSGYLGNEEEYGGMDLRRKKEEEEEEEEKEEEIYCGLGHCRPVFLQSCAHINCVTLALCLAGLSTSTLSIYINSQITTLERQFGFSSSVSGILLSCNDIGYLLTTLFMSYLARRVHILRAISFSTLLFGLSGLLCTFPFFASLPDLPPVSQILSGSGNSVFSNGSGSGVLSGSGNGVLSNNGSGIDFGGNNNISRPGGNFEKYLCTESVSSLNGVFSDANGSSLLSELTEDKECSSEEKQRSNALSADKKWMAVFFIGLGMVFQGFGKSPRHPFITTYIDDNVPKIKTTFYLGIIASLSMFGPVLAFTLGGLFSKMYLTLEETTMSPQDPRWVGAWWLGFLLFGSLGIIASIPTLFLPRRLRPQPHLRKLEAERKRASKGGKCCHELKEFLKGILRVARTPVYMSMILGTCSLLFGVSGMISFLPKYLETQFMIPTWKANIILGVLNITAAAGGTLLGGFLTSKFKMSPRSCLKMVIAVSLTSVIIISSGYFLGCDQPEISMGASAGASLKGGNDAGVTCEASCRCDDNHFFPTCGSDGVTYFSPCHAGCSENAGLKFHHCTCVNSTMTSTLENTLSSVDANGGGGGGGDGGSQVGEATPGFCHPDCGMLYPYAAMNFVGGFTATLIMMPGLVVTVRSVSDADKPLSIGLSSFLASFFGWFLGPLVFGRIVDSCCLLWSSGCDGGGSCTLYDLATFRTYYHTAFMCSRIVGCLFYIAAFIFVVTKNVQFSPHHDHDVIPDTLPAEAEKLMLNSSSEKGMELKGMMGNGDDDFRVSGGGRVYKGKNNFV
ncbi:hypothetical protein ACOMHN_066186 [Nucella lapillus]